MTNERRDRVPAKIYTIPFHDTDLLALQLDGKSWVPLRHHFEKIGVDADRQIAKIQKQKWATTTRTAVVAADGKVRDMIVADVRTFLMALATIPASRVSAAVRPLLEAYQAEAADVIEAYFARGMAPINPRVAPEQVSAVVDQALGDYRSARERLIAEDEAERAALARVSQGQLQLLGSAVALGLIDSQWGQTKAQVIIARGLGEVPAIPQDELPLYVEEFMRSKQVPRVKVGRFSGAFGKKVLDRAAADGVAIPGKRNQELPDGSIREVTAWTREHLPVFERAWAASYANDVRLKA